MLVDLAQPDLHFVERFLAPDLELMILLNTLLVSSTLQDLLTFASLWSRRER